MTCQRCNVGDLPARLRLVEKPGAIVERILCDDCAEVTGWTYPVTTPPSEADEQPPAGAGLAPKARRRLRAVHRQGKAGKARCGTKGRVTLTKDAADVTCRRCSAGL